MCCMTVVCAGAGILCKSERERAFALPSFTMDQSMYCETSFWHSHFSQDHFGKNSTVISICIYLDLAVPGVPE